MCCFVVVDALVRSRVVAPIKKGCGKFGAGCGLAVAQLVGELTAKGPTSNPHTFLERVDAEER